MSLTSTLAKMAVGMMVSKQVSKMMGGGRRSAGGGLGSILGQLAGGRQASSGGLGDILGQVMKGGAQQQGGLGSILGQLAGGGAAAAGAGGLGGLLGKLAGGGAQAQSGGLGGLLESLGQQGGSAGGLGGLLGDAMSRFGEPQQQPTAEQDAEAGILLSAMLQAAKADGQIDQAEKEAIFSSLGDISQDEMNFINQQMAAPVDPEGLAAQIPAALRQQAYTMSLLAIDLDNQSEAQYLDRFAKALGIQPQQANAIHQQMEEPALYA